MTILLRILSALTIDDLTALDWHTIGRDPWFIALGAVLVSLMANAEFFRRFQASIRSAPRLDPIEDEVDALPTISVVIPAYNEAANITECLKAVLENDWVGSARMQVIVADDESEDETATLAEMVAETDERVTVLTVPPRPTDEPWRGKNWACAQAAKLATGEYLLFVDADVRLEPWAIARTLANAKTYKTDLLSCAPKIICGCFSEWLVQPIMAMLIAVGFSFEGVNNPKKPDKAAAAGPFMLFRRAAYEQIGTHSAVAAETVEDFALARLIKSSGLTLRYVIGLDVASVRMYRSFSALWEGWTKNFHIAAGRNAFLTLSSAAAVFLIFVMPWVGVVGGVTGVLIGQAFAGGLLLLASLAAAVQLYGRVLAARIINQRPRYVWLGWLGGGIISAMCLTSLVKTETGWGWTWRGRSLAG